MGKNKDKKHNRLVQYANGPSLEEINGSVKVPHGKSFLKTLFAYLGPGALVAVGYMDPGNWSTSITGGQDFQYLLMSIILISSLIAMLLQYMAAKLGIVTRMDLAQLIRLRTTKSLSIILWISTELAVMATDIAEVIGGAIALYLLFKIPLIICVIITVFDVLLLLLLTKMGFRKLEAIVVCLIFVILFVFVYIVALSNPNWSEVLTFTFPHIGVIEDHPQVQGLTPLMGSLGIIGATVMPHNLYLHSSISQIRKIDYKDPKGLATAVKFSTWDSNLQLTLAFFVNALLLIMGVTVFKSGQVNDPSFFGLYQALSDPQIMSNGILATLAKTGVLSTLFAVALLASGQNSTITGTLTGQVIMEGFVHMKMPLWARRLVTRLISVVPVLLCVFMTANESDLQQHQALNSLMENSQIFLAFALPFSVLPLLIFTDSKVYMGKKFKNSWYISLFGWLSVISLVALNMYGLPHQVQALFGDDLNASQVTMANSIAYIIIAIVLVLLAWVIFELLRNKKKFVNPFLKKEIAKDKSID